MITTEDGRRWNWYHPIERYTVTLVPRSTLTYAEALARIATLEAKVAALSDPVIEDMFDADR